jgi:hypothetical protein
MCPVLSVTTTITTIIIIIIATINDPKWILVEGRCC